MLMNEINKITNSDDISDELMKNYRPSRKG